MEEVGVFKIETDDEAISKTHIHEHVEYVNIKLNFVLIYYEISI